MSAGQPTLQTARLLLRPFDMGDAPRVQELASARAIADTTLSIPHPYPEGAAEEWIRGHAPGFATGKLATFAIVTRADEALVGAVGLVIQLAHSGAEIGYWIGEPYWGRGFATEAARGVVGYAFGHLRLHRVYAHHFTRNPASGKVMQKLGMRPEGVHRESIRKWDEFVDVAHYSILAREWAAQQAAGSR